MSDDEAVPFPAIDRPSQAPAAGTVRELITPGAEVPDRRVHQRASIGVDGEPMIEIDEAGTVFYVGGNWEALVGFTKPGPAALQALLDGVATDDPDVIRASIETALSAGTAAVWPHKAVPALPFLKVLPIPSATEGGAIHALVGLSASAAIEATPEPRSLARHRVTRPR